MKTNIRFRTYLAQIFLELKIFRIRAVEEIEGHFLYSVTLVSNIVSFVK